MDKIEMKIKTISLEEMLIRPENAYNPSIWKQEVKSIAKREKVQFYVNELGEIGLADFYVSYISDGVSHFQKFSAFHHSLTNGGFCKVTIDPYGNVRKFLFKDNAGNEGYIDGTKANRLWFAKYLTPNDIMVCKFL